MPNIYTAAMVPISILDQDGPVSPDPDPRTCNYTHLDLTTEQLGRTQRYNCWGFTFLPRRYWVHGSSSVDQIILDNCTSIPDGSVQCGDVIRYRDANNVTTHTGRVWQTDAAGHATLVRSKWGSLAEYVHMPLDVPSSYGTNLAYFRQHAPLVSNVIADFWMKDSPGDSAEQCSGAPWWISPDILVDVPPYDGIPELNPEFGQSNRIWAAVHNRSGTAASNVYLRYYWADPAVGLAPSDWHLIPASAGHPNPAGPLNIPANSSISAPYVEWIPSAAPAHQCLLAIAYIDDDPKDSNNLDPLVYPFDVPWDNNITQRNVTVIHLKSGSSSKFSLRVGIPFHNIERGEGSIEAILTYAPQLPIFGFPEKVVPLQVALAMGKEKEVSLGLWSTYQKEAGKLRPSMYRDREMPTAGKSVPSVTFIQGKPHTLNIQVKAPNEAKTGSIYYLHLAQHVSNRITGGYTIAIMIA